MEKTSPRISLLARIFIGYVFVILLLSFLILFFSFRTTRSHYIKNLAAEMNHLGLVISRELIPLLQADEVASLDALAKKLGSEIQTRITVIDPEGKVLADSKSKPGKMENHKARPEISQALQGYRGKSMRYSTTVHEEMLYVALPIQSGDKLLGVVRLSLYLKDINTLLNTLVENTLLPVGGLIIAASLLAALLISRSVARPIMDLVLASRRVAKGDFDVRVNLPVNGELKELQNSFNSMTHRVKCLFSEVSRQKEYLDLIIASIREGLVVIDREGNIKLVNASFRKLSGQACTDGTHYRDTISDEVLREFIRESLDEKISATLETSLNDRVFSASASLAGVGGDLVVVFHDITELKKMENVKREFVANVSHELKTPLTVIKGFTETLRGKEGEDQRHLDIIRRHTDRLIAIVNDLLHLAQLEEKGNSPDLSGVDLGEIIRDTVGIFRPQIEKKNLSLDCRLEEGLPKVLGDYFDLEQAFINLIDNAVKYTETGKLSITTYSENGTVVVTIEDTGIGIPPASLPRVFERFYVVDKSRTRELGGTGLGLAIVKHVVVLSHGKVHIESTLGKGTKIILTFPRSGS